MYFKPFMVGGAEWYVYNISKQLVKMGHEVDVFTSDRYGSNRAPSSEVIDGINVHRLPLSIDWSYRIKVWKGLREELSKKDFDIIHTYDYAQEHSKIAIEEGKRSNTKTALTVFDIHSMIPRAPYKQLPMSVFEHFFAKNTLNAADKILVRAPMLVASLTALGVSEERIIVTPSGINDESLGHFDGGAFLEKYGINGSPVVLFVGRLNPLKGPQYLIEAAPKIIKDFPNAAFVLVGPDQSGYLEHLKARARLLGIGDMVHFTSGIYDFTEKMQAYSSCDVFVLPTSYEGTSQSIFEAMARAKPIVATNVGGIPSQIEDGKEGLLVPHGDTATLSRAILEILKNHSMAANLGKMARYKVLGFRYSVLVSNLVRIYEELNSKPTIVQ